MKTLLTGKPYVPSVETDLKKTFAREYRRIKAAEEAQRAAEEEREAKVRPMKAKR